MPSFSAKVSLGICGSHDWSINIQGLALGFFQLIKGRLDEASLFPRSRSQLFCSFRYRLDLSGSTSRGPKPCLRTIRIARKRPLSGRRIQCRAQTVSAFARSSFPAGGNPRRLPAALNVARVRPGTSKGITDCCRLSMAQKRCVLKLPMIQYW